LRTLGVSELVALRQLLRRSLNEKQVLLLREISEHPPVNVTRLLAEVSAKHNLPISTLKGHVWALRDLGLVVYAPRRPIRLTPAGWLVMEILGLRGGVGDPEV